MSINPLSIGKTDIEKKSIPAHNSKGSPGFAEALDRAKAGAAHEYNEFHEFDPEKMNTRDYLQKQIARYESMSVNEDHEAYIRMMKHFAENNKN